MLRRVLSAREGDGETLRPNRKDAFMLRLLIISAFALLAGCASGMTKSECLVADWRAIGYEDGAAGREVGAVTPRRSACAKKAQVGVDMDAYLEGRAAGLAEFCRPASGYDWGARGGRYAGQCEGRNERLFVAAYEKGARLYGLVVERDAAGNALAAAERRLAEVDRAIAFHEAALISPATPHLERIDHLAAIKSARDDRDRARDEIGWRADALARAEDALENYRVRIADARE
jgi:hypothetical protein